MSEGIESKPQLWTMRAPLSFAGASNRSNRLPHEQRLAGEVGVVGAGGGARLDQRHAVVAIRADGGRDRGRPRRKLGQCGAVL